MTYVITSSIVTVVLSTLFYINYNDKKLLKYIENNKKSTPKSILRIVLNNSVKLINSSKYIIKKVILERIFKFKYEFYGENGGVIESIIIYPIKSVSTGYKTDKWTIDSHGVKYDRIYSIAKFDPELKKYIPLTLKDRNTFSTVRVTFDEKTTEFIFTYPISETEKGTFKLPGEVTDEFVKKYSSDMGDTNEIKLWLCNFETIVLDKFLPQDFKDAFDLNKDSISLIYSRKGKVITKLLPGNDPVKNRTTFFQDYFPILLCSRNSYNDVVSKLESSKSENYVEIESFRPNIVVESSQSQKTGVQKIAPFDEDTWSDFDVISSDTNIRHHFNSTARCFRCSVPNIHLDTGFMDPKGTVSKTMSKYRRVDEGVPYSACFGIYVFQKDTDFTIKKGDKIDILNRDSKYFYTNPFFEDKASEKWFTF
ncbi:hypothetical protein B5S28_g93 [[Candida] boidinii]|nr:hypothetical protein B5S28_g93 [[Candida] boidinii]OWB71041.1 hypothetical protein B5S31_g723 [[Candida] boidinii]GME74358.1 unnamed protein product [[Candida] boidinii]